VTVATKELDATPIRTNQVETLSTVPEVTQSTISQPTRGTYAIRPVDLIMDDEGSCRYVSAEGEQCTESLRRMDKREAALHWLTSHVVKEFQGITSNNLDMSQATILHTRAKMAIAGSYIRRCPFMGCKDSKSSFHVEAKALANHMMECAKLQAINLPEGSATRWARSAMQPLQPGGLFGNVYEEAIWNIHHGYGQVHSMRCPRAPRLRRAYSSAVL
jgi:hypothetical protein